MGTTGTKLNPAMIRNLTDKIPFIHISLDNDQSGSEKTTALISELPNAVNWPVPKEYGNDPGEAWMSIDLKEWVAAGLGKRPTQNSNQLLDFGEKGGDK